MERAKVVRNARLNFMRRNTVDWRERARQERERAQKRITKVDQNIAQGLELTRKDLVNHRGAGGAQVFMKGGEQKAQFDAFQGGTTDWKPPERSGLDNSNVLFTVG